MAGVRHLVWTFFCFWFGVAVLLVPATEPPRAMVRVVVDANAIARAVVRSLSSSRFMPPTTRAAPKKLAHLCYRPVSSASLAQLAV